MLLYLCDLICAHQGVYRQTTNNLAKCLCFLTIPPTIAQLMAIMINGSTLSMPFRNQWLDSVEFTPILLSIDRRFCPKVLICYMHVLWRRRFERRRRNTKNTIKDQAECGRFCTENRPTDSLPCSCFKRKRNTLTPTCQYTIPKKLIRGDGLKERSLLSKKSAGMQC